MKKFEYTVTDQSSIGWSVNDMNKMGDEGWELVNVTFADGPGLLGTGPRTVYFWKREIG